MIISMIVAMDSHRGIGKNNQLLCHLPADLKRFKALTMGHPIIMGRHTFVSIGKALPGRLNVVLSRDSDFSARAGLAALGVVHCVSLDEALQYLVTPCVATTEGADTSEIFIIGGASLYKDALPMAQRLYITDIHHAFDADTFFPEIDAQEWHDIERMTVARDEKNPFDMTYSVYERVRLGLEALLLLDSRP